MIHAIHKCFVGQPKEEEVVAIATQPKIFHIHVDGTVLPEALHERLHELGYTDTPFSGHPEGFRHFEPNVHLTLKLPDGPHFRHAWEEIVAAAECHPEFKGYLEGEYIPEDIALRERPQWDGTPVPFSLTRRLLAGVPHETFRECELHLVMDKDASDPALIQALLEAGLYGAYIPKSDHTALVLTAQGKRAEVDPLFEKLWMYVELSGGVVRGTLKKEVAIRHALYGVDERAMPEVIDRITWK